MIAQISQSLQTELTSILQYHTALVRSWCFSSHLLLQLYKKLNITVSDRGSKNQKTCNTQRRITLSIS